MSQVVVVGGGVAGLSVASALARRGRAVLLYERETQLGAGSSAKSAAIFRLAVEEPVNVQLALRGREIGRRLSPEGTIRALGGFYPCAADDERQRILEAAAFTGVREARPDELPAPLGHRDRPALFSPQDGAIDVHTLIHGLAREARLAGAKLLTGTAAEALDYSAGRVAGVRVASEVVPAEVVVDATGAWSPDFAPTDVGIRPHRRHLFVLDTPHASAFAQVVWDLSTHLYLRPESGGLLVSPCDEEPMPATDHVPTSSEAGSLLFQKLATWAPALQDARVRTVWAGLRPLTADHRFVVGFDPRVPGLFRLGGFGGHGMTAGAAAGELAAAMLCGESPPEARELDPARFARVPSSCAP